MNPETLLYRVVRQSDAQGRTISSRVFWPAGGQGRLHVFDGSMVSPQQIFGDPALGVSAFGPFSGIVAVSVGECESLGLSVSPGGTTARCQLVIDFSDLPFGEWRSIAVRLRRFAANRGWIVRS